ncbi:hypothetical protein H8356DRAFT_1278550 [Neocallimastix lanati (nom. inval.)]|nr:hypothetical protein H8356DRAFT_1278550 [Neocallimastix sp. JGI-2020a]
MGLFSTNSKNLNEKYIEKLKHLIKDNSYEIFKENHYEWEINNWDQLSNCEYSPNFEAAGYTWNIKLYPNRHKKDDEEHVSIYLKNLDVENDETLHICSKYIFYIRNSEDYSNMKYETSSFSYFNNIKPVNGISQFINTSDLTIKNEEFNKPLVQNNKTIIGVYIRVYKYNTKKQIVKELGNEIENVDREISGENYFEWEIKNFNKLLNEEKSPEFEAGGYKWKLKLYPNGYNDENKDYVSLCIQIIRNHSDYSCYTINGLSNLEFFNKNNYSKGIPKFIKKAELLNKSTSTRKPLVNNNRLIIGAYIRVYKNSEQDYYEWEISKWRSISNFEYSPKFSLCGYKWKLKLYVTGENDSSEGCISIFLKNLDAEIDNSVYICSSYTFFIRNCDDCTCFYNNGALSNDYSRINYSYGHKNFIRKSDLFKRNNITNKSLVENNKTIIGVYLRVYRNEEEVIKEKHIQQLKEYIDTEEIKGDKIIGEDYYEWKIDNWESLNELEESPEFEIVLILIYLNFIIVGSQSLRSFDKENYRVGYQNFIEQVELFKINKDSIKPLVENGKTIISVYIRVCKYSGKVKYFNTLKSLMVNNINFLDSNEVIDEGQYEWRIGDWDKLNDQAYSPEFMAAGHLWKILLYPNGISNNNNDYVSIFLTNLDIEEKMDSTIDVCVNFIISLRNYKNYSIYKTEPISSLKFYSLKNNQYGYSQFIKQTELFKSAQSSSSLPLIENSKTVISIYIQVYNYNKKDVLPLNINNKYYKSLENLRNSNLSYAQQYNNGPQYASQQLLPLQQSQLLSLSLQMINSPTLSPSMNHNDKSNGSHSLNSANSEANLLPTNISQIQLPSTSSPQIINPQIYQFSSQPSSQDSNNGNPRVSQIQIPATASTVVSPTFSTIQSINSPAFQILLQPSSNIPNSQQEQQQQQQQQQQQINYPLVLSPQLVGPQQYILSIPTSSQNSNLSPSIVVIQLPQSVNMQSPLQYSSQDSNTNPSPIQSQIQSPVPSQLSKQNNIDQQTSFSSMQSPRLTSSPPPIPSPEQSSLKEQSLQPNTKKSLPILSSPSEQDIVRPQPQTSKLPENNQVIL